jgi:hypothetical protein
MRVSYRVCECTSQSGFEPLALTDLVLYPLVATRTFCAFLETFASTLLPHGTNMEGKNRPRYLFI